MNTIPDNVQKLLIKYGEVSIIRLSWTLTDRKPAKPSTRYGVSSIVKTHLGEYLLIRHTYDLPGIRAGTWTTPGGKVEEGETFEAAAVREIFEETGAKAHVVGLYKIFHHTNNFPDGDEEWWMPIFHALVDYESMIHDSDEILEVGKFRRLPKGFAGELGLYYSDLGQFVRVGHRPSFTSNI